MTVLDREALLSSPLADLHLLGNELGIDGFRRLRKEQLVDAILAKQGGDGAAAGSDDGAAAAPAGAEAGADEAPAPRSRSRSRRRKATDEEPEEIAAAEPVPDETRVEAEPGPEGADDEEDEERPRRRRRGGRGRGAAAASEDEGARDPEREREPEPDRGEERIVEGVVELLSNGSGFVRVSPPDPTDDDVYISAAQVKRCELVSGDRISGPVRTPRRSERFPSLVRVDTINGQPADEVAEGTRFEDLPATFPTERLALGLEDPTVKAIEWLTPFGRGSRVTITGAARSGKTEALRRIAAALGPQEGIEVFLVLCGARPEEVPAWQEGQVQPAAVAAYGSPPDAQAQAAERTVELAKRVASRGGHAVVLVDTLEYLAPQQARRLLAAARAIVGGGSLTVVASAPAPLGGESTVIALDHALASMHRFPALDLLASGTIRADLLVGEAGAEAIAKARVEAAR